MPGQPSMANAALAPALPAVSYSDEVIKKFTIAAMVWAIVAFSLGIYIATELCWPDFNLGPAFLNFGRLRPVHTSVAVFAFGGNALFATSFFVVQRTSRARLAGPDALHDFLFWGYQFFIVMAGLSYLMGFSRGQEYSEPEWHITVWLVLIWVLYAAVFIATLMKRAEPHIYVANWFFLAFILTVAVLVLVNNAAVPVSFFAAKSYVVYSGVQNAMVQWWYGHNAVGFFLTAGFLGIMYYFIPKQAGRPVYSYRLSVLHFWSLIFLYIWAGPHHLHYTSLPDWTQTLGMAFSIMLWMPSWGGMINGLDDPVRRLGQAAHRPRTALFGHRRRLLRHVDLRGAGDGDPPGQLAVALHRLDRRPCAFRRARLGGVHQLRRHLLHGPGAVEAGRRCIRASWSPGTTGSRPLASFSTSPRCGSPASCRG